MARYTTAYSSFVARLDEVETLRRLAAGKERTSPVGLRDEVNALGRGAVVLLCSHLEAYVRELGEVALASLTEKAVPRTSVAPQFFYHISHQLLGHVRDTDEPERLAQKVFAFIDADLDYWSRTGPFPRPIPAERFNSGFSNPAFKKIKRYFNRFGYTTYRADLERSLRASYHPTVNMVDHLVDTRNKIAHGDPTAVKTPAELTTMIAMTQTFCGSTDSVFAGWWRASFCAIR